MGPLLLVGARGSTYRLLESSDLSEGDRAWSESVRLFHSATLGDVGSFSGGFVSELLAWGLSSGIFSCCLLGSCHLVVGCEEIIND